MAALYLPKTKKKVWTEGKLLFSEVFEKFLNVLCLQILKGKKDESVLLQFQ